MHLIQSWKDGHSGRGSSALSRRAYLDITHRPVRVALTRLLLGEHCLAVALLRHPTRTHRRVERHDRLCRFGDGAVEDELHALFSCRGTEVLVRERDRFWKELRDRGLEAEVRRLTRFEGGSRAVSLLTEKVETATVLAWFCDKVLSIFKERQIYRMY